MPESPEQLARADIDEMLKASGWSVQNYKAFDPMASTGIALREVPLKAGRCDYLLLVNRKPVGIVEAKKQGVTLSTVAEQSAWYASNLPAPGVIALDIMEDLQAALEQFATIAEDLKVEA